MDRFIESNRQALAIAVNAVDKFPWKNKEAYAKWLTQTFHYASQTISLLSLMVARTNIKDDPELHYSRVQHLKEEIGHEEWVRKDLSALGFNLEDFPELSATRWLWVPQFYYCDRSVEQVYGYTILLEQLAVERGAIVASKIKDLAGGKRCDRFLTGHDEADVKHVERDLQKIAKFQSVNQEALITNMFDTAKAYELMLSDIVRSLS